MYQVLLVIVLGGTLACFDKEDDNWMSAALWLPSGPIAVDAARISLLRIKPPSGATDGVTHVLGIAGDQRNHSAQRSIFGEPINGQI